MRNGGGETPAEEVKKKKISEVLKESYEKGR